ncbi:Rv3654c family TadE-like protein [Rothia sp. L_38]|uniref:Rv3654c family TadE-like protein n=1 Tax=Rothia sp. L_38 TaxID=3422315 RepID=UPI003D6BF3D2
MNRRFDRERGSSTVATVGLVCALLVLGTTCAGLIGVITAQHRAAAAADVAALAAADAARGLTPGEPCAVAERLALANGAQLGGCGQPSGLGGTVDVRTFVDIPGPFAFLGPAQGLSRAGPLAS